MFHAQNIFVYMYMEIDLEIISWPTLRASLFTKGIKSSSLTQILRRSKFQKI